MSRWFRSVVLGPTWAFATLAAAEPARQCPRPAGSEVVVKALRFSDGRSYAFMVTNNGAAPIRSVRFGLGGPPYIEATVKTEPVSMGSPSDWRSRTGRGQDPRLPGSHSHPLIFYHWTAEDEAAWIQPGRSLSGFAVQLPTPREMELAWLRERKSRGAPADPSDLLKAPPSTTDCHRSRTWRGCRSSFGSTKGGALKRLARLSLTGARAPVTRQPCKAHRFRIDAGGNDVRVCGDVGEWGISHVHCGIPLLRNCRAARGAPPAPRTRQGWERRAQHPHTP